MHTVRSPNHPVAAALAALLAGAVAGCGGTTASTGSDTGGGLTGARPAALQIVAGNAQVGTVGAELAEALVVKVVDASGGPIAGQVVNFRVIEGGGATYAGVGVTNANGTAQERWTLGSTAGTKRLEARAVDPATGAGIVFATFEATARPGAPAQLAVVSGSGQSGLTGAALPAPLVARVSDQFGNAVPGVAVSFVVTAGSGTVSPASASTDAAGDASTFWTLGSVAGAQRCEARSEGLAPAVFDATAVTTVVPVGSVSVSLAASSIVVGQSTLATAVARDASGAVLTGRAVSWSSGSPAVAAVGATGTVTALGVGTAIIKATIEGKSGFETVTVLPAPPAPVASVVASVSPASIEVGQTAQASAVLRDAGGNVLAGRTVAWSSAAPAIATVDAATGLVTGVAAGTADLTATSEGRTGTVAVTVTPGTCTWTPVRTESLATVPAGAIPGGGLAGSQGPMSVGGRTAYGSTSDWIQLDIPSNLAATDAFVAVDVDVWLDGLDRPRLTGVMFFADHAADPTVPWWLNDYGEVGGVWAGLDHRDGSGTPWKYGFELPPDPLPSTGWGGGETYPLLFRVETAMPAQGWHHVRVEGDRSRCEFQLLVDDVPRTHFTGTCDAYGANVTLHGWVPLSTTSGTPSVAFSNLVVSRGSGSACQGPWRLVSQADLTTLPAGAIAKTGAMGGQGPAAVGGRTAWLQWSDWNVLEVPTGLTAADDEFAVEADLLVSSSGATPGTNLVCFGRDAPAPAQFTSGVQVLTEYGSGDTATAAWQQRTPGGLLSDPSVPLAFTRDAWHTVRIEGKRSTCQFDYFVDGAPVASSTLAACDVTGPYFVLNGGAGGPIVPANTAWSNLRVYVR